MKRRAVKIAFPNGILKYAIDFLLTTTYILEKLIEFELFQLGIRNSKYVIDWYEGFLRASFTNEVKSTFNIINDWYIDAGNVTGSGNTTCNLEIANSNPNENKFWSSVFCNFYSLKSDLFKAA